MKRFDIVTIGSATRDVFLRSRAIKIMRDDQFSTGEAECFALGSKIEIDDIVFETGGGATNTAVGFARQGFRTSFIGKIGHSDARGDLVLDELRKEKVDTSLVVRSKHKMTAYSVILLTPRGERTVLVYRGASAHFHPHDFHWRTFKADWLYVTSLGGQHDVIKGVWAKARQRGMKIAWNPGSKELSHGLKKLRPLLAQTDILSVNQEEATSLLGLNRFQHAQAFDQLRKIVGGVVVVTLGTDGSLGGNAREAWHAGIHHIKVTDTTGAGDAYGCGFTARYIQTKGSIPKSLQFGNANSESVIQRIGAKDGLLKSQSLRQPAKVTKLS